jgi:hypothetical protein
MSSNIMMKLMVMIFGLILTSCDMGKTSEVIEEGGSCANSAECSNGQLCLKNECRNVDCLSSSDCDLEQFCDQRYQCSTGCENDEDCIAGDSCNLSTSECENYGCRETQLDCEIGEFCNVPTGECYEDNEPHCKTCGLNDLLSPTVGEECLLWNETANGSCTVDLLWGTQNGCPSDEICYPLDPSDVFSTQGTCWKSYAVMTCNPSEEEPCPRGFSCIGLNYTDGSTVDVCYGDCQYYVENGFLP